MFKGFAGSFTGDLSDEAITIYHQTVNNGKITFAKISNLMQLPQDVCRARIDELLLLGLVTKVDSGDAITPVNPRIAAAEITAAIQAEIRHRNEEIERINALTAKLLLRYEFGHESSTGLQHIDELPAARLAIEAAANQCEREVVYALSGGPRRSTELRESLPRDLGLLSRGVSMRGLYQTSMRYDRHTIDYVKSLSRKGAQARTLDEFFKSLVIFDQKIAFFPWATDSNPATIITDSSIVGFLYDLFDRSWTTALPFDTASRADSDMTENWGHPITRRIILLLIDGEKDEAIARRLGISVRTCRKHIASVMDKLGAESRFQAGYLAHPFFQRAIGTHD